MGVVQFWPLLGRCTWVREGFPKISLGCFLSGGLQMSKPVAASPAALHLQPSPSVGET